MANTPTATSYTPSQRSHLLTEKQASEIYGFSLSWFRRKRWEGGGPEYIKVGYAVRYSEEVLQTYFDSMPRCKSTSDINH